MSNINSKTKYQYINQIGYDGKKVSENTMFDVLIWLEEDYFNHSASFDYYDIKPVLDFALMWNLFESKFCNRDANVGCLERISTEYVTLINDDIVNDCIEYFSNRYIRNNELNTTFNSVKIPPSKFELVKSVLIGQTADKKNKIEIILLIAYRFRNNLFHGEKELRKLSSQAENFEKLNRFLATLLLVNKSGHRIKS